MKAEGIHTHDDHEHEHPQEVPQDPLAVREPELYKRKQMVSHGTYEGRQTLSL
jgi:hypothetical protein